jgi:hypothetical protein
VFVWRRVEGMCVCVEESGGDVCFGEGMCVCVEGREGRGCVCVRGGWMCWFLGGGGAVCEG